MNLMWIFIAGVMICLLGFLSLSRKKWKEKEINKAKVVRPKLVEGESLKDSLAKLGIHIGYGMDNGVDQGFGQAVTRSQNEERK